MKARAYQISLILFLTSILFSLAGYLALRLFPSLMLTFGPVFPYLVKVPTWIYMIALPVAVFLLYYKQAGLSRSLFFFGWGCLIGAIAELAGTITGFPFGSYVYTDLLGAKILGHVPWLIPPSWYAMGLLSLDLSVRLGLSRWQRILAASVFMVLWDVSLDPAMSYAFQRFWFYPDGGFYYGMPAVNWAGWLVTSLVVMWGFEYLGGGLKADGNLWGPRLWFLNAAFPLGIILISALWPGFLIGAVATAIPFLAIHAYNRRLNQQIPIAG